MQTTFSTTGPLPPGLKPVMSQHQSKARLAALQLRWLGRNLAILEKQIKWNLVEAEGLHGAKVRSRALTRAACSGASASYKQMHSLILSPKPVEVHRLDNF